MATYPFDIKLGKKAGQTSTRKGVADGTSRAEVDNMLNIISQMKRNEVAAKAREMRNKPKSNHSGHTPVRRFIAKEMSKVALMAFTPLEVLTYVMALRMSQGKWELAVKAAERLAPYTNSKAPTQITSEVTETRYDGLDLDARLKNLSDGLDLFESD